MATGDGDESTKLEKSIETNVRGGYGKKDFNRVIKYQSRVIIKLKSQNNALQRQLVITNQECKSLKQSQVAKDKEIKQLKKMIRAFMIMSTKQKIKAGNRHSSKGQLPLTKQV